MTSAPTLSVLKEYLERCPLCNEVQKTASPIDRGVGGSVFSCSSCGFAYLNPRPSWAQMLVHYQETYANTALEMQWRDSLSLDIQRADIARLRRWLRLDGASVIDVGCGAGLFLEALRQEHAATPIGIEPSLQAARFAHDHVQAATVMSTTFEDAESLLQPSSHDLVVGMDLIEHLYQPRTFVRWSARHLREEGFLYLRTPNWDATLKYGSRWEGLWRDYEHVSYFSLPTLTGLLSEESFHVVEMDYEPARSGLGQTERLGEPSRGGLKTTVRRALQGYPPLGRLGYRTLQRLRRARNRSDIHRGTAHELIVVAQKHAP